MDKYFVLLNKENIEEFKSVIPSDFPSENNRITIGCVSGEGAVLGAISMELLNYQYDIDWLYVEKSARLDKVATALLHEVFRAVNESLERYPVTARIIYDEEDSSVYDFFLSIEEMEVSFSHNMYIADPDDIATSDVLNDTIKKKIDLYDFFEVPINDQKKFLNMLKSTGQFQIPDYDLWKANCLPELCKCVLLKNKIAGAIFIQKRGEEDLCLSFLYSKNPTALLQMLTTTARDIQNNYPGACLYFETMDRDADSLAKKIFPEAEIVSVYEAWW